MPLFTIFIFAAVFIGAGVMLAPAWSTRQPRIALATTLAIALVVGGTVFWASAFGWNNLVIDYMLFALVSAIVLGGTLSQAQARAEARGEILLDRDQGWPGPQDLVFFAIIGLLFIIPAWALSVPMGTDAQGLGYLALMARDGGGLNTLAPYHPEITYLYPPGMTALSAYLSLRLGQPMPSIQFGVGAVLGVLCVWLAYDLGAEIENKKLGRAFALAMLGEFALFGLFLEGQFSAMMGVLFGLAFVLYALRYQRHKTPADLVGAGLLFGATVLANPNVAIAALLGFVGWLVVMNLGQPRLTGYHFIALALGVPFVALLGLGPWLIDNWGLFQQDIASPYTSSLGDLPQILLVHGVLILGFGTIGAIIGLKQRAQPALFALIWLALALDFATTGIIPSLLAPFDTPLTRYDHPARIGWSGAIIPLTILGGYGLYWVWEHVIAPRYGRFLYARAYVLMMGVAVVLVMTGFSSEALLASARDTLDLPAAYATWADVDAMLWLKAHAAPDARILNYESPLGDWVPVIAERDSVFFPMSPVYIGADAAQQQQAQWRAFWQSPTASEFEAQFQTDSLDYVIVPQAVDLTEALTSLPYLQLVYNVDGAQVYEVISP